MLNSIKHAVREFFGVHTLRSHIAELGSRVADFSVYMSREKPALACVTILCKTPGDDGKITTTTHGGEAFIAPGKSHTLKLEYSQRMLGQLTYFLSGHPNLVITSFQIGNHEVKSSWAGTKYGECDAVVEVGQMIQIRLEYRVEGQSL